MITEVADKRIPKRERKKITPWLSKCALEIAEERRKAKANGDLTRYRQLNATFQRQARRDKEKNLQEILKRIEELGKTGKTRDFFKEIKSFTGTFETKCAVVRSATEKDCTEGDNIKERWKEYSENLYIHDPSLTDTFVVPKYEDEPTILEREVHSALFDVANGKSTGGDNIPIELIKAGGDNAVKILTKLCNLIWMKKSWPSDWKKSIFIPLFKKGDKKDCSNYRTISLISHASKIMLKVLQKRLEAYLLKELPDEQAGFMRGRGTRDHISNLKRILERCKEYNKHVYVCFIDYSKAFDCVDHHRLWNTLLSMGVPAHLIMLLKSLYENQAATVRTEFGETEKFQVLKGVRQGCILSPLLYNIYAERVLRDVLEECRGGVRIAGRTITNLRYADDTTLLAQSEEELVNMVTLLKKHSSLAGLRLNTSKTKVLATGPLDNGGTMKIDGEEIEAVDSFVFLGAKITSDSTCEKEIRRRIAMGKCAVGKLMKIWKDRGVTKGMK